MAALPFLFRLAAWPDMPQRAKIIDFIADISNGNGAFQGVNTMEHIKAVFDAEYLEQKVAAEENLQQRICAYVRSRKQDWIKFLEDKDSNVVRNALPLIAVVENMDDEIFTALVKTLSHVPPDLQSEVLLTLASYGGSRVFDILRKHSKDKTGEVRLAALIGLLHLKDDLDEATINDLLYFIEEHDRIVDNRVDLPEVAPNGPNGFLEFFIRFFKNKKKESGYNAIVCHSTIEKVQNCRLSPHPLAAYIHKKINEDYQQYISKLSCKSDERLP